MRADRDVNLSADDYERHAARDNKCRRFAREQREQRLWLKERGRGNREENQQHTQGESNRPFSEVLFQNVGFNELNVVSLSRRLPATRW